MATTAKNRPAYNVNGAETENACSIYQEAGRTKNEKSMANFTYNVNPLRSSASTLGLYTDVYAYTFRNQTGRFEIIDCSSCVFMGFLLFCFYFQKPSLPTFLVLNYRLKVARFTFFFVFHCLLF